MMRPARTAKNEKRCLSAGTVVSVKARIFDDEGVDEESRWSSQFAAKGEETLRGTVVSHYKWCHDPVVRYEYDGKPVSTKLKDLTVIEIIEQPAVLCRDGACSEHSRKHSCCPLLLMLDGAVLLLL